MAKIPTYGGPQVTPTIMGYRPMSDRIPRVPKVDFSAFDRIGNHLEAAYTKFLEEQDEARVTEAMTALRRRAIDMERGEGGWASQFGDNALRPDEDGRGLVERSDSGLQDYGRELSAEFTPRQQKLFNEKAQSVYQSAYAGVSQHVYQQAVGQKARAQEGAIAQAVEAGGSYYGKPDMLAQSEDVIRTAVDRLASFRGWDANTADLELRKQTSAMYFNAITAPLAGSDDDPEAAVRALGVLEANAEKMLSSDVARARKMINPVMQHYEDRVKVEGFRRASDPTRNALGGYAEVLKAGGITPQALDAIEGFENGVLPVVSGGSMTMTDKSGADEAFWKHGASQLTVAQAKETAEQMGVVWDVKAFKNDRSYNIQLGQRRYDACLRTFAGDTDKALAAYFSDQKVVQDAQAEAERSGGTWVDHMPKAVREKLSSAKANIAKAREVKDASGKAVDGFSPMYAAASKRWPTWRDAEKYFEETDPRAKYDPNYRDRLVTKAMADQNKAKQDYEADQNALKSEIVGVLFQNRGDLSAVPTEMLSRLDVNEVLSLRGIAERISEKTFASDPQVIARLSDSDYLAGLDIDSLKLYLPKLSARDRQTVLSRYFAEKHGAVVDADGEAAQQAAAQMGVVLDPYVVKDSAMKSALALVPGYADMAEDNPEAAGLYRYQIAKELALRAQARGKAFNDVEIREEALRISREYARVDEMIGSTDKPAILLTLEDLPNEAKSDVYETVDQIALAKLRMDGQNRRPTDYERQAVLTDLMLGNALRVPVPPTVIFDAPLMTEIRAEWAKRHGGKEMPKHQQIRYYILARAAGRVGDAERKAQAFRDIGDFATAYDLGDL